MPVVLWTAKAGASLRVPETFGLLEGLAAGTGRYGFASAGVATPYCLRWCGSGPAGVAVRLMP